MDRKTAKELRIRLQDILDTHGISGYEISVGNASYDSAQVTFKVEVRQEGAGSVEERDLATFAEIHDLDTNKVFNQGGTAYTLVGYKTRARKNPWIVQRLDNSSRYVISNDTAKRWFKKDDVA